VGRGARKQQHRDPLNTFHSAKRFIVRSRGWGFGCKGCRRGVPLVPSLRIGVRCSMCCSHACAPGATTLLARISRAAPVRALCLLQGRTVGMVTADAQNVAFTVKKGPAVRSGCVSNASCDERVGCESREVSGSLHTRTGLVCMHRSLALKAASHATNLQSRRPTR